MESLEAFDDKFQGQSYLVTLEYKRPLRHSLKDIKPQMKEALSSFLRRKLETRVEVQVNQQVKFYISETQTKSKKVFLPAGRGDLNAGGFLVSIYIDNINHCIREKNLKIQPYVQNYQEWWLLLIDTMAWNLGHDDLLEVKHHLRKLEFFERLLIINWNGQLVIDI